MIEKRVLKKGQVVIPKAIRDLLGIHEGDTVIVDVDNDAIQLHKRRRVGAQLHEIAERHGKHLTMQAIKQQLTERHAR
ncbi:MAG: AbrB/MazE/SpoVT family DNA-binding domain-containing protein [Thermoplasmatota archaeon]